MFPSAPHKLPKLQPPHPSPRPWVPEVCRAVGPQVGTRRPRSSTARGPSSRRTRGARGAAERKGGTRCTGCAARAGGPLGAGDQGRPESGSRQQGCVRARVSAGSAGASLREPPAPRRPRVPLPRLPRAPPSSLLLLPPQSPCLLRLGLSGLFIAPRGLPGARARTSRAPRVTPAPARPRVAGTSQQQPALRQPRAPRGARASCGARCKLPIRRDSPKSGIIPEKGAGRRQSTPSGTPGIRVPGQVCARPAGLQLRVSCFESPTPQPGSCSPHGTRLSRIPVDAVPESWPRAVPTAGGGM